MSHNWNDLDELEVEDKGERGGNNLLLVDTLNLCFRWKHERYKPENYYTAEPFVEELIETVNSLAKSYSSIGDVILCVDSPKGSTWRKNLFPDYKDNRRQLKEQQTEEEAEAFKTFIQDYQKALDYIRDKEIFAVVEFEGVEADDTIAYITNYYTDKFDNIWIASGDADLDQLIGPNVHRFNYATKKSWKNVDKTGPRPKEIKLDNWGEHHVPSRDIFLDYKVLAGDSGDNIPGVNGVGPKRAVQIISKYGSIQEVLDSIPLEGTAKYIQNLNSMKDQLELNIKLMDLNSYCEQAIGPDNLNELDNILEKFVDE